MRQKENNLVSLSNKWKFVNGFGNIDLFCKKNTLENVSEKEKSNEI